ncbi:aminotransferase class V-fold PLP-dependent enzyme [Ruicaihuangia caeni]|uniref:Aminotransferase class V-fold PLP-dependent enzyme n=1 Tax=Ruicaihuangia caeni TaxID=3042517 RepID=A0AAW6T3D1_9MICO|nr:aminotransferase class V-fold PLP-dependent enzyme [Klugiella sp. YN-L-19]MDI2097949.1 aminotransferase class V-fold PLP-dependent enzyme [Klugiella sp. YN-L-19]
MSPERNERAIDAGANGYAMRHDGDMPALQLSPSLESAIAQFEDTAGYLAVASIGIPPRHAVSAMRRDLDAWARADRDPQGYDEAVGRTREHYARLVGVAPSRVAIGSQTSVMASVIAAAVPPGAEVLCVQGDFSSLVAPFSMRSDIHLRAVPLEALADAIGDRTWLVAFSLVQSATGAIADVPSVLSAARMMGAYTLCDTTQAAGVMPVDAALFDATICHAYKWLCSPRGVAFMTLRERFADLLTPVQAGWYAGADVWESCYWPRVELAADAHRFDVSPAWQAWIGAEQSIGMFAGLDLDEVWQRTASLGSALCEALELPEQHQAIVTWPDAEGDDLHRLIAVGIRVSSRAGRLRASFHLWNTEDDVEAVVHALRP